MSETNKLIDRLGERGNREYGVRYADGHVVWHESYLHAWWAYWKSVRKK